MDKGRQVRLAEMLRALHEKGNPVVLPNAWDAGSARLFESRGARAIATTSGGVVWSLGYGDGEQLPLEEVLANIRRIMRVIKLPLTVDFETGYGRDADAVEQSVRAAIQAGAVGVNIEDAQPGHGPLRSLDEAAQRIAAARRAGEKTGVPVVINARIDAWMGHDGNSEEPLDEALERARRYVESGADCLYPIALTDTKTLTAFIQALDAPVNVLAGPQTGTVADLARLGVARITVGTRLAVLALENVDRAVRDMLNAGRFDGLDSSFSYSDAQKLHVISKARS